MRTMLTLETLSSNLAANGGCPGDAVTAQMAIPMSGKPMYTVGLKLMVARFAKAGGYASTTH